MIIYFGLKYGHIAFSARTIGALKMLVLLAIDDFTVGHIILRLSTKIFCCADPDFASSCICTQLCTAYYETTSGYENTGY